MDNLIADIALGNRYQWNTPFLTRADMVVVTRIEDTDDGRLIHVVDEQGRGAIVEEKDFRHRATEPDQITAAVTVTYRNYAGQVETRTITPIRIWYGHTEWHIQDTWLMTAYCHSRKGVRDFKLQDMVF